MSKDKNTKEVSVELKDQDKEIAKQDKAGYELKGYDFAPEGPGHVVLKFAKKAK